MIFPQGPLIRDVFNMARFHVPQNMSAPSKKHLSEYISTRFADYAYNKPADSDEGSQYCLNLEFYSEDLTDDEKKKQLDYESCGKVDTNGGAWLVQDQETSNNEALTYILDNLTGDDLRRLIEAEDELSQAKG